MANLLKHSKRGPLLPRIANGNAFAGERYAEFSEPYDEQRERHTLPPLLYTLDVRGAGDHSDTEYQLQLTEDEVIRVTAEWLMKITDRRRNRAKVK